MVGKEKLGKRERVEQNINLAHRFSSLFHMVNPRECVRDPGDEGGRGRGPLVKAGVTVEARGEEGGGGWGGSVWGGIFS